MKKIFNRRHLKLMASSSMLIDHTTVFTKLHFGLEQNLNIWLRSIGRIAFPLYAFMFVEGFCHTHNKKRYILNLLLLSIISEPFFDKALTNQWINNIHQNIIWLFFISALCFYAVESVGKYKYRKTLAFLFTIPAAYMSEKLHIDYGILGIIPIFTFYLLKNYPVWEKLSIFITYLFEAPMHGLVYLTIPILLFYNEKEPKMHKAEKAFHQYFYPAHLALLSMVSYIV